MDSKITRLTKILLDLMFFSGMLATATIPLTFKWYSKYNSYFADYYIPLIILFALSGFFAVLILKQLRNIFDTVLADDCFVEGNIKSLNLMGKYSFFIAFLSSCRLLLYITPAVLVVIIVFLIAGLFSKVLSQVFDKAITYKLENDLTI